MDIDNRKDTTQAMYFTYERHIAACWRNHCCCGEAIRMTYSKCAPVVIFIQHAKRMRPVILSSVVYLALPCVSTLSPKWHDFRKKNCWSRNTFFWFSLQLFSEIFLILRRIQWDIIVNVQGSSCKAHAILSDFEEVSIFSVYFRKVLRHQNHENPYFGV